MRAVALTDAPRLPARDPERRRNQRARQRSDLGLDILNEERLHEPIGLGSRPFHGTFLP